MIKKVARKYRNLELPVKASLWFVMCGVLKDIIDVVMTPIFTRLLTVEQYGYFNVYNSWFQIFKIIFALNLFHDVFNVGLSRFENNRDRFGSSTLGFITASTLFYLLLYLLFKDYIDRIIKLPDYLILLFFVHTLAYAPYYCWIRRERYDYHYMNVVIVSSLYIVFQPLTSIMAILYLKGTIDPGYLRIIASIGIQVIIGCVLYIEMMFRGKRFYDSFFWKYSLKTGIELVPYSMSKVLLNQSDRLMINYYYNSADTAIYSVAHSAAYVLQVVVEALNGAFVPWLYRKIKINDFKGIRETVNVLITIVAICTLLIDLVAPEIMVILGNKGYHQGVFCIPILAYSVYLIFVYTLFTNVELFYGQNINVAIASSIGMIINISLNIFLIPKYGFIAAAYTTALSYSIVCVCHFFTLERCLVKESIQTKSLFDIAFITYVSIGLLFFTVICNYLYSHSLIRCGIVAIISIFVVFKRKNVVFLIRKLMEVYKNG